MNIPLYITALVIGISVFAAIALPITLARASQRAALPVNFATSVGLVLGAWLVLTTVLAIAGAYHLVLWEVVPVLGIGLLIPLIGGGLAIAFSPGLRNVLSNPAAQSGVIALQV